MRDCLHCGAEISAHDGFWELVHQPEGARGGMFYTLCSNACLAAFVRGGDDE